MPNLRLALHASYTAPAQVETREFANLAEVQEFVAAEVTFTPMVVVTSPAGEVARGYWSAAAGEPAWIWTA